MSYKPTPGEVWRHEDGSVREVVAISERGSTWGVRWCRPGDRQARSLTAWCSTWTRWARHATRVTSHEDPGDVA